MNQLRQLMLEELQRRNCADTTIRTYLHGVAHFSRYFRRSPDQLGPEDIRKPGGQLGHPGHWRPLVPPEQVQQVVPVLPLCCKRRGQGLPKRLEGIQAAGQPYCHQVTELPPIQPYVIEYQCLDVTCPHCGEATQAPLPAQVQGQFGPRLMALIAYLTVVCRMPRRVLESFLEEALNISVSLGSTQNLWQRVSAAVAQPCQELEEQLKQEPVLNSDETGWRSDGERRYLWALVARMFVFYTVARTHSSEVLIHLLGAVFEGILCSDRYSAYFKYQKGQAQLCWAHLKRDILGIRDFAKTTEAERFARDALALYARLFRLWRKFQGNLITRDQLVQRSLRLQNLSALFEPFAGRCGGCSILALSEKITYGTRAIAFERANVRIWRRSCLRRKKRVKKEATGSSKCGKG